MKHEYRTRKVCSSAISFELNDGILTNVVFTGGCNGNLKAIGKLVEGQRATDVIERLRGNTCGYKDTSCADQLSIALQEALQKEAEETK